MSNNNNLKAINRGLTVDIIDSFDLANDLYFIFIETLDSKIAKKYVVEDQENIGGTKNTPMGIELFYDIKTTIEDALNKEVKQWL